MIPEFQAIFDAIDQAQKERAREMKPLLLKHAKAITKARKAFSLDRYRSYLRELHGGGIPCNVFGDYGWDGHSELSGKYCGHMVCQGVPEGHAQSIGAAMAIEAFEEMEKEYRDD